MSENIEEKRIAADILIAAIQAGAIVPASEEDMSKSGIDTNEISMSDANADIVAVAYRIILDAVIEDAEDFSEEE